MRRFDLESGSALMVVHVEKGSPAQISGLREGDIIVAFEGEPIAGVDDLHRLLTHEHIGARAELSVLRSGERQSVSIIPAESPAPVQD